VVLHVNTREKVTLYIVRMRIVVRAENKELENKEPEKKELENEISDPPNSSSSSSTSVAPPLFASGVKLVIERMIGDGNCLFRSISRQIYGDQDWHEVVRSRVVDYLASEQTHFSTFIPGDFSLHVQQMRKLGSFGSHTEIQAVAELFNRTIETYAPSSGGTFRRLNILQGNYKNSEPPIRLLYRNNNHYDALIDPFEASIGVGLGIPELGAGKIEKEMLDDAKRRSLDTCDDINLTEVEITESVIKQSLREYIASSNGCTKRRHDLSVEDEISPKRSKSKMNKEGPYPRSIEELVCNGFELKHVLFAYSLFGDSFDQMLSYLVSRKTEPSSSSNSATL